VHDATGSDLFVNKSVTNANLSSVYNGVTKTMDASSKTQDLCEFCHVYGTTRPVYQDGMTKTAIGSKTGAGFSYVGMGVHALDAADVPNITVGKTDADLLGSDGTLGCADCHNALPHAAGYNRTSANKYQGHYLYNLDSAPTNTNGAANAQAMCVRCHGANMVAGLHESSHPVTSTLTMDTSNYGAQQVAWVDSGTCFSCHEAGNLHSIIGTATAVAAAGTTPAFQSTISTGTAFTSYGFAKPYGYSGPVYGGEIADGACAKCHTNNGTFTLPSAGVGVTY
jgi:hypothetical protein